MPHGPQSSYGLMRLIIMVTIHCQTGEHVRVASGTLAGAALNHLTLDRALLDFEDLRGTLLVGASLRSAWLECASLEGADLTDALLVDAYAPRANFSYAHLRRSILATAIFDDALFVEADFFGAYLGRASLRGAELSGADMRCEGLERAFLAGATADRYTQWPKGFDPLAHGVKVVCP